MKIDKKIPAIFVGTVLITLTLTASAQAQPYTIPWWTIDGGGGNSTGGGYTLSGTIGQPDAGVMTGGGYILTGGFWGMELFHMVFFPLILKN